MKLQFNYNSILSDDTDTYNLTYYCRVFCNNPEEGDTLSDFYCHLQK